MEATNGSRLEYAWKISSDWLASLLWGMLVLLVGAVVVLIINLVTGRTTV